HALADVGRKPLAPHRPPRRRLTLRRLGANHLRVIQVKEFMVEESGHVCGSVDQGNGVYPKQQMAFAPELDWMPVELHEGDSEFDGRVARKIRKRLHEPALLGSELRTDDVGERGQALRCKGLDARKDGSVR